MQIWFNIRGKYWKSPPIVRIGGSFMFLTESWLALEYNDTVETFEIEEAKS